jgi:hypothetical protein
MGDTWVGHDYNQLSILDDRSSMDATDTTTAVLVLSGVSSMGAPFHGPLVLSSRLRARTETAPQEAS